MHSLPQSYQSRRRNIQKSALVNAENLRFFDRFLSFFFFFSGIVNVLHVQIAKILSQVNDLLREMNIPIVPIVSVDYLLRNASPAVNQ